MGKKHIKNNGNNDGHKKETEKKRQQIEKTMNIMTATKKNIETNRETHGKNWKKQ